jgi:hypothetical protein
MLLDIMDVTTKLTIVCTLKLLSFLHISIFILVSELRDVRTDGCVCVLIHITVININLHMYIYIHRVGLCVCGRSEVSVLRLLRLSSCYFLLVCVPY